MQRLAACVALVALSGCSATADEGTTVPPSEAESTTSVDATTTTGASAPLFIVPAIEAEEIIAEQSAFGIAVNDAFNDPDPSALTSLFRTGAFFTDPVNPSMKPDVAFMHELYGGGEIGSEALAEARPTRALPHGSSVLDLALGNQHGAATVGAIQVVEPPGSLRLIRSLPVTDGRAERGQHYFEVEMLRAYPDEVVAVLYLSPSDTDRVATQVQVTDQFIASYESAWASRDADAVAALYSNDATRFDHLIGSPNREGLIDWVIRLLDDHQAFTIDIDAVYASSSGPAAVMRWRDVAGERSCSMTIVTIWDLDSDGLITSEFIYYDPADVLDCGWAG